MFVTCGRNEDIHAAYEDIHQLHHRAVGFIRGVVPRLPENMMSHTYMHMDVAVRIYVHICIYVYIYICIDAYMYICAYVHICIVFTAVYAYDM